MLISANSMMPFAVPPDVVSKVVDANGAYVDVLPAPPCQYVKTGPKCCVNVCYDTMWCTIVITDAKC